MFIPFWGLGLIALALWLMMYRCIQYFYKIKNAEYEVYIDTTGISQNPPRFIELMEGKTINIKFDKYYVCINQVSFLKGMSALDNIQYLYSELVKLMDKKTETETEHMRLNIRKMKTYSAIVGQIYELSKRFVKNKGKYRKELFKKSQEDFEFILNVCAEVIDYWSHVGKLLALLSQGSTPRKTYGDERIMTSRKWGSDGTIEIKPRYVLSMN